MSLAEVARDCMWVSQQKSSFAVATFIISLHAKARHRPVSKLVGFYIFALFLVQIAMLL
jgi:hypothetical protein